jgi:hypothetical protein
MHIGQASTPAVEMITGVASEAEHAALYSIPVNIGLPNELVETWVLGAGSSSDNIQGGMQLVSAAADGSASAGGVFWAAFNPFAYWDVTGFHIIAGSVTAVLPGTGTLFTPAQAETQHNVILDAGWSTTAGYSNLQYRLMPDNTVRFTGSASHASITVTTAINASNPLPPAYRPATTKLLAAGNSPIGRLAVEITSAGVINALANSSAPGTIAEVDQAIPLGV